MLSRSFRLIPVASLLVVLAGIVAPAEAQLFSNAAPIAIADFGIATPYPSTIVVAGAPAAIQGIAVRLNGFNHSYPSDVAALLVGPNGQRLQLLNAEGGISFVNVNLTLSSGSTTPLPVPYITGEFAASGGNRTFAAPAPAPPFAGSMQALAGSNPNGVWQLYVQDLSSGDGGSIAGGWSIEFSDFFAQLTPSIPTAFTYQGKLTGGPATGNIDARFTLWRSLTSTSAVNRVAPPVTLSSIAVVDGLLSATVDLGVPVPTDRRTWLQIEVANPAGSGFVSLTPRQPMTFSPIATRVAGLEANTLVPLVAVISGPQGDQVTGSLTIQAPGTLVSNGAGSRGGTLRLVAGNCNHSDPAGSPTGTSQDNNVHIIAGDNTFTGVSSNVFNGNIQFFAGNGQPERVRIVGDNGNVGIGTSNPTQKLHVIGNILASGTITPSCGKLKENIVPMADALDRITGLNAVRFDWTADEAKTRGFTHDLGFIAEDVAKAFPEVVFRDDKGEVIGLDYSRMSAVAVGAIKQLKAENEQLKAQSAELKVQSAELKQRLDAIETMLQKQAK